MAEGSQLDILGHLQDSPTLEFGLWEIHLPTLHIGGFDLPITRHTVMMWFAAALLVAILVPTARRKDTIPRGLRNFFEVFLVFLRDNIALPQMGHKATLFLPFLATVFFFILCCNLLGLVPFGATATGNISVTASLAAISFLTIHLSGIWKHGPAHYARSIVPPVPIFLYPVMLFIEIAGHLTKPFALAIRLFANMLGGHIVLLVVFSFIFTFKNLGIAGVSVCAAVALSLLEILVAFIQAYIFTFLTAAFIGAAISDGH